MKETLTLDEVARDYRDAAAGASTTTALLGALTDNLNVRLSDAARSEGLDVARLAARLRELGAVRGVAPRYGRFNDAYYEQFALALAEPQP